MKKTRLRLPRRFLSEIGFVAVCQQPLSEAMDRVLPQLRAALNTRAGVTLEELNQRLAVYDPPAWAGYHIDRRAHRAIVRDGLFTVPVLISGVFEHAIAELRRVNFAGHGMRPLPVECGVEPYLDEPPQILLHDTRSGSTYLEPFEIGCVFLQRAYRATSMR